MDHEILVRAQIEEGDAIVTKLVDDGFDVTVAFWAKLRDGGLWYLYIATQALESMSLTKALGPLYAALEYVRPRVVHLYDIRLVEPKTPMAREAIEVGHDPSDGSATRYHGSHLGNIAIEEAYIYPSPAGPLSRESVVMRVARLLTRPGPATPSLVTMIDGSRYQAVPIGLRSTANGGVDVVLREVNSDQDRSISADDVTSIINHAPQLVAS